MPHLASSKESTSSKLLRKLLMILLFTLASGNRPEDPIKCSSPSKTKNCTITNSYGTFPDRTTCKAAEVQYPETEVELISIVANATMAQRKMKVATRFSHSIPKLVCLDDDHDQNGLLISTKNLNHIVRIDSLAMTITVQSGVTLRQLIDEAAKVGLALPYSPYWWGLTIGGLLSTGAHGSSLWGNGSSVHDHVVEMRIVSPGTPLDGYVKVRTLNDSISDDFNAARVSLGVLGVISQVTLQLQPIFKRSITNKIEDDFDLGDRASIFANEHEFGDITWYPSQRKAIYRMDDRISSNMSGNGQNNFIGFQPQSSLVLATLRASARVYFTRTSPYFSKHTSAYFGQKGGLLVDSRKETQESLGDANGKCTTAKLTTGALAIAKFGLTNDGKTFKSYPIIGYQNRLQASGTCQDSNEDLMITACAWDPRAKGNFFHQTAVSIGLSQVKSFVQDVQALIKLEPKSMCGVELYNGILMRYVKASNAYLGKQVNVVDIDITYYRSKDPMSPRMYEDILEEVEQIALFKYGGLPHWGKNRNVAFIRVIEKFKNAQKFLDVKTRYDPLGLFSSEWTDQILGIRKDGPTVNKEGCALEGLCICSQDIHCAPKKGYFCRPGRVYVDSRVCSKKT